MPSSTNPKSEHLEARPCSSTPTCVPNHGWCMSINSHAQFCIAVFMSNHAAQMRRLSPHPRPAQTPQLFTALEVEALVEKAHAEERALLRSHLIESSALSGDRGSARLTHACARATAPPPPPLSPPSAPSPNCTASSCDRRTCAAEGTARGARQGATNRAGARASPPLHSSATSAAAVVVAAAARAFESKAASPMCRVLAGPVRVRTVR